MPKLGTIIKPLWPRLNRRHPLAKGLIGAWPMTEGGGLELKDASGYGSLGTFVNTPTWVRGQGGPAVNFNGTTQHITVPDNSWFAVGVAMSASAWVKGAAQSNRYVIAQYLAVGGRAFALGCSSVGSTNTPIVVLSTDGTNAHKVYSSVVVAFDSTWHQIGFTFGAGVLRMYVDGVEDINPTKSIDLATAALFNSTQPITIGCLTSTAVVLPFAGAIDMPMIWNRALTPQDMMLAFTDPYGLFRRRARRPYRVPDAAGFKWWTVDNNVSVIGTGPL